MATIIIHDNDSAVLDVLTQALELEGHLPIPILAPSTVEMSKSINHYRPDLVLVDYRSNNEMSSKLLLSIRRISAWIPVIALSCDQNIAKVASKLGFNGFLAKPFDLDELFEMVGSFLDRKNGLQWA